MRTLIHLASAPLLASCLLLASPAVAQTDAQKAEAGRLYKDARSKMEDKAYAEAALGFEAAANIIPHAVALYTAAQAWELSGNAARASDAYARALSTPKLNESQAERARDRLAALSKGLGRVAVIGPDGWKAQLDDHSSVPLPAQLHGSAGVHQLTLLDPSGKKSARPIKLAADETLEVDAESKDNDSGTPPVPAKKTTPLAEPRKNPVEPEPEPSGGSPVLRTVGFIATGAGVAALGAGVLFGLSAKDAESTYNATPSRETFDHARSLQTNTNILLIGGGVLTAAGVGLVIWQSTKGGAEGRASVGLQVGPGSLQAQGSF